MTDTKTKFQQRLEEKRRKEAEAAAAAAPDASFEDVIPEHEYQASDEDRALDEVIDRIGILEAYRRWCGKMDPKITHAGQTESIMISCPIPGHRDSNPSAWVNTDSNLWRCGTCETGGDVLDIAAFYFNILDYKTNKPHFHDLRREMAKSMGYTFIKPPGAKAPVVQEPEEILPPPTVEEHKAEREAEPEEGASVTSISYDDIELAAQTVFPTLQWRDLVTPDTFLDVYMKSCIIDDAPEEYHFWNGMMALGLAVGRDVTLFDGVPVHGNLFVCLLGDTGDGKSRSFRHLKTLIREALPSKWEDENDKGVVIVENPGSGEHLIQRFMKPVPDPSNPKLIAYYAPVKGLIEFSELSQLAGRGQRTGNVLKPTLHDFYDAAKTIGTGSMTTGEKKAEQPFGSCFSTTQPRALKELITGGDADSGFLNRWVFASGKQKKKVAIGGAVVDIKPAVPLLKEIQGWAGFGKMLQWSPEAAVMFTQFHDETIQPLKLKDDTSFLTRLDLTMKKLILLFSVNEKQDVVQVSAVEKAMLMLDYLLKAYDIPAQQVGNTIVHQILEDVRTVVLKYSEKNKNGPSLRDIRNALKHKKYNPKILDDMVEYLTKSGEVVMIQSKGTRGPATTRYRYVG